ncbi:IAP repeat-containing protein 6 [Paenibacillus lentus]|uniref:IAP repeat-containing protein 6 n=1 Tax=Paenibacillus lentus TaxID=1338368 RepID=A0A3S8S1E6_9BACL|nr:IAP repeat-containing protein 6 [Paenibacillus lentus]
MCVIWKAINISSQRSLKALNDNHMIRYMYHYGNSLSNNEVKKIATDIIKGSVCFIMPGMRVF